MRALRMSVVCLLAAAGLVVVGAAPTVAAPPDPVVKGLALTKTVTMPVQVFTKTKTTPIQGGTSYYCAVGSFIPHNDLAGWVPVQAAFVAYGQASTQFIGDPPYSDAVAINGLVFPPVGYQHHTLIGDAFTYSQGGTPGTFDTCAEVEAKSKANLSPTATVTYERTDKCAAAIGKVAVAKDAVKKAKKKADSTTGTAHTAAVKALNAAKADLKKAKKKAKKKCT